MDYGFNHEGKEYVPSGAQRVQATQAETDARNREREQQELAWLKTGPERLFLYVATDTDRPRIQTWLGTSVSEQVWLGPMRRFPCFGPFPSKRRAVRCTIYGTRYVGWYYESSGQYCRLRKAKRQV